MINPALPLTLVWAAFVAAAVVRIFARRRITTKRAGSLHVAGVPLLWRVNPPLRRVA